jgi:chromosome segregation ATPase
MASFKLEERIALLRDTVSRLNSQHYKPRLIEARQSTADSEIGKYLEGKYQEELLGLHSNKRPLKRSMSEREIDTLLTQPHFKADERMEQLEERLAERNATIKALQTQFEVALKDATCKGNDLECRLKQTELRLESSQAKMHNLQSQLDNLLIKQGTHDRYIKNLEREQKEGRLAQSALEELKGVLRDLEKEKSDLREEWSRKEESMKRDLEAYRVREKHFGEEVICLHKEKVSCLNEISALLRHSEAMQQLQDLLQTSRGEQLVSRVQQLLRVETSSRRLQTFYNKVAALVRDCSATEENSKNFVWKWVKRVVEQYMQLKRGLRP